MKRILPLLLFLLLLTGCGGNAADGAVQKRGLFRRSVWEKCSGLEKVERPQSKLSGSASVQRGGIAEGFLFHGWDGGTAEEEHHLRAVVMDVDQALQNGGETGVGSGDEGKLVEDDHEPFVATSSEEIPEGGIVVDEDASLGFPQAELDGKTQTSQVDGVVGFESREVDGLLALDEAAQQGAFPDAPRAEHDQEFKPIRCEALFEEFEFVGATLKRHCKSFLAQWKSGRCRDF